MQPDPELAPLGFFDIDYQPDTLFQRFDLIIDFLKKQAGIQSLNGVLDLSGSDLMQYFELQLTGQQFSRYLIQAPDPDLHQEEGIEPGEYLVRTV